MTTTTVNLASTPVVRNEFKPIPQGTYELELGDVSVKMPKDAFKDATEKELKVPYVEVGFKAFGGSLGENGRKTTSRLFIGNKPGMDGVLNYAREQGLIALFAGLGATPPEISVVSFEKVNKDGEVIVAEHLNPMEVVSALQALRGERVKAYIKVKSETYGGKTQDKNEIARFLARETA